MREITLAENHTSAKLAKKHFHVSIHWKNMTELIQEKNLANVKDVIVHSIQRVITEGTKGFVTIEKTYECKNQRKNLSHGFYNVHNQKN